MYPIAWHAVEGHPKVRYRSAVWSEDLGTIRGLFSGYRQWLADHGDPAPEAAARVTQGLAQMDELIARLPGPYEPPHGDVLLWFRNDSVVACGVLRELEPGIGEIKRIHIRPDYRGGEFGQPFVRALIVRARDLGFSTLRSDALGSMAGAIEFHEELGFRRIPRYWPHPAAGTIFFERDLGAESVVPL